MKDWTTVKQICIFAMGVSIGVLICLNLREHKPTKHYPIEVSCYWETEQASHYPTMEADSVKGDTIYKDGLGIVNKNIKNVKFK